MVCSRLSPTSCSSGRRKTSTTPWCTCCSPTWVSTFSPKPELGWEKNNVSPEVTEGPQFIEHGGRTFLFYSTGGCWTDGYSLGAHYLESGQDALVAENWRRVSQAPLFTSNVAGKAVGPGHNSFFTSPDGTEDWIVYHANPLPGQGCGGDRSVRMHPFSWTADGFPNLGKPAPLGRRLPAPAGE